MGKRSKNKTSKRSRLGLIWRWSWRLVALLVLVDMAYLAVIWPDWSNYQSGPVETSNFIDRYQSGRQENPEWPSLRWNPVPLESIPEHMMRAVVVAEDSRFYEHKGIDVEAFKEAMQHNWSERRMVYGASTISQQTVKNLFLSPSRSPLRKWHELVITLGMERNLSKQRILELYLNVAEFGRGIYGVDAAARYYWGVPIYRLDKRHAIELAATLPSPVKHNPLTQTRSFQRRVAKIQRYY